jgi:hypothetical protein
MWIASGITSLHTRNACEHVSSPHAHAQLRTSAARCRCARARGIRDPRAFATRDAVCARACAAAMCAQQADHTHVNELTRSTRTCICSIVIVGSAAAHALSGTSSNISSRLSDEPARPRNAYAVCVCDQHAAHCSDQACALSTAWTGAPSERTAQTAAPALRCLARLRPRRQPVGGDHRQRSHCIIRE